MNGLDLRLICALFNLIIETFRLKHFKNLSVLFGLTIFPVFDEEESKAHVWSNLIYDISHKMQVADHCPAEEADVQESGHFRCDCVCMVHVNSEEIDEGLQE